MASEVDPRFGIGGNHPPDPVFELRRSRVSCDWVHPKRSASRPRHYQGYWRIYRDGVLVDSFLTKANAEKKLRRLKAEAGGDE